MIIVDICLSDIPKERITEGKNGKKYCKVVVDTRREKDKFDNTHTVYMNQTKDERTAKTPKVYVGSGKELVFNNSQPVAQSQTYTQPGTQVTDQAPYYNPSPENSDDLPF